MISVQDVSFSYTAKPFIRAVSFEVGSGEIFGFLGPSGAGKSTLQKILTGVLGGYRGQVIVGGIDVRRHGDGFYEKVGVDFEFPSLYEKLTARENIEFFASLYKKKPIPAMDLLAMVGLEGDADKRVSAFSKGMKSRLNFIKALAHQPEILFLDEPTSGLDPTNARIMKNIIKAERDRGRTIILTTHNMHDAAELCDRVAFIVDGTIRAQDTPRSLVLSRGDTRIKYSWGKDGKGEVLCSATNADENLLTLIRENRLTSIHSQEPTLEDIFIDITGRGLE